MPVHCYTLTQVISSTSPTINALRQSNLAQNNSANVKKNSHIAIPQCESSCNIESSIHQTHEILEIPELSIPENVDIVEQNITSIQQTNVDNGKQQSKLVNNTTVQINFISPESLNIPISTGSNKLPVGDNDEQPIEVRDIPIINGYSKAPIESELKHELYVTSSIKMAEPAAVNKGTGIVIESYSMPSLKPKPDITDQNLYSEDARTNKDINSTEVKGGIEVHVVPRISPIGSQINPITATDSACLVVQIMLRTINFNTTLGSDLICPHSGGGGHSFNITYNVPLSKYMKENMFELIFV